MHEKTLDQFIIDTLGIDRDSSEFRAVYAASVRYCSTGYKSIKDFHADLQSQVDFSVREFTAADFRMMLTTHRRFVLKMRYFVFTVLLSNCQKSAVKRYEEFGISRTEAVLAWNTLLKHKGNQSAIREAAEKKHADMTLEMVTPQQMMQKIKDVAMHMQNLKSFIGRSVYKNLRWVRQTYNMTDQDLASDVMCQVLSVYYMSLPNNREPLHELNYLKATVTSRIDNMNNKFGAKKRERLVKNGEGFTLMVVSENQLHTGDMGADSTYLDFEVASEGSAQKLEQEVTISRLLDVRHGSKKWALRNTVLGHHTVAFTAFLRRRALLKEGETSIDFFQKFSFKQIVSKLSEWLKVSASSVEKSLHQMREAF